MSIPPPLQLLYFYFVHIGAHAPWLASRGSPSSVWVPRSKGRSLKG